MEFAKCMRGAGIQVEALIEYVSLFQQGEDTTEARKQILIEQRELLLERMEEMLLELYGEGKRFWDLVRSGKANEVLGSRGYKDNKKYLPIPSSEIDKSAGTLTQNPY